MPNNGLLRIQVYVITWSDTIFFKIRAKLYMGFRKNALETNIILLGSHAGATSLSEQTGRGSDRWKQLCARGMSNEEFND